MSSVKKKGGEANSAREKNKKQKIGEKMEIAPPDLPVERQREGEIAKPCMCR